MRPRHLALAAAMLASVALLPLSDATAQIADPALSTATVAPGLIRAAWADMGPGMYESLADQGHPIAVTIVDTGGNPLPGVDPSRITLGVQGAGVSDLVYCATLTADAPTDVNGETTISGHFEAAGTIGTDALAVLLDGVPLGDSPLPLTLVQPDAATPGRIDLLDARALGAAIEAQFGGTYTPELDIDRDGYVTTPDYTLLGSAMTASCPTLNPPYVSTPLATASLYFDSAATVTQQDVALHDYFYLYLFVDGADPHAVDGIEFSIPALAGPDILVVGVEWQAPAYEYYGDGESTYMVMFADAFVSAHRHVATLRCILRSPVVGLNLTLEGLPAEVSSFGPSASAGWVSHDSSELYEFVNTTGVIINPVTGVLWSGFEHEALDGASLNDLGDRLDLSSLGSMFMGIGGAGGAGGSGADGSYQEFMSQLSGPNLPDGAFVQWDWEDANGLPAVQLRGDVKAAGFDMDLDMGGLNSGPPELILRAQGQVVEQRQGYSGLWRVPDGLPDTQRVLYQDGEVEFWQGWTNGTQVTLDDKTLHFANEIVLRSNTGATVPRNWLKNLRMSGDQLPAVQIGNEGIQRFDLVMAASQNLLYLSEDPILFLVVEDPASPAQVTFSSTNGLPVRIQGYPPPWPPNATPTMVYHFEDSSSPQAPGLGLTLTDLGGPVSIDLDLSEQQTNTYQVTALLGGNVVDQYVMSGASVGTAQSWNGIRMIDGGELVMMWGQPTMVDLTPPPGTVPRQGLVELDELRMLPFQGLAMPDGLRATMTMTGTARYAYIGGPLPTAAPSAGRGALALYANVPNPFNPSTELRFRLAAPGEVNLSIYDLRGRRVATVLHEWRDAGPGSVTWDGRDHAGQTVASGVYHAVLRAGGEVRSRKISLVK